MINNASQREQFDQHSLTQTHSQTHTRAPQNMATEFLSGVIEGFYGPTWSSDQRKDLFASMQHFGLSIYIYAPKDDAKHRMHWRQQYTDNECGEEEGRVENGWRGEGERGEGRSVVNERLFMSTFFLCSSRTHTPTHSHAQACK